MEREVEKHYRFQVFTSLAVESEEADGKGAGDGSGSPER